MAINRSRRFWRALPPYAQTMLMLLPVVAIAALLRIPFLTDDPPGFRHEEATVAFAAQQIERGFYPIYFRQREDTLEPAFVYLANITGRLAGWGVTGPRLAAALLGIAAAAACSLWYRKTMGTGWGLAGGLLVATSFWQIVFSRQAVPSIAMAAAGAIGLWALYTAASHRRSSNRQLPSGWYGLAGLAFGMSFYTDVTMRAIIPVVALIGVFLFYKKGYLYPAADHRGLLLGCVVMVLVAAPLATYFWQEPDSFRQGIENLRVDSPITERVTSTLNAIVWTGEENPAHTIPGRALLDPMLVLWGIVGLGYALRRPLEPLHAGALIWFAGFLIVVMAIAPADHGQMLALTPVLFFFPLRGMHSALTAARSRGGSMPLVATAAIVITIAGSAAWSIVDYVRWSTAEATYAAFAGDVRDAVSAMESLPPDNLTAYFGTGEHGRIVRYLAPARPRRDFDNPDTLPMPSSGPAYLVVPVSTGTGQTLLTYLDDETLVASGSGPDGQPAWSMWLIDARVRERLPYAVPAIFFDDGPTLLGFDVTAATNQPEEPSIEVVLVYRVTVGSDPFSALARLVELDGDTAGVTGTSVRPGPDRVVQGYEIILARVVLPFPETPGMVADLQAAAQTLEGEYMTPSGPNVLVFDDYFALLNAIGYIGPEP
jgi:hypothetical protein